LNGPLRIIFALAVLGMWVCFGWALSEGTWEPTLWALLIAAHVVCAIVFFDFPLVFSYGYAISVLVGNLLIVARYPALPVLLVGGACILYGLRLWYFIHARHRDASYRDNARRATAAGSQVPLPLRLSIWVMVSWLMAFHAITTWNVAQGALQGRGVSAGLLVGVLIMLAGLALEAAADAQKLDAKRAAPQAFVTGGLYRRIRHPNYLGEIVFQLGLLVVAIVSAPDALWLIAAVLSPAYIVALMAYASKDLDEKQAARYGQSPEYQRWRTVTGRLWPALGSRSSR
jgi:steroid 5-alpha reductase family enzyme